MTGPPRSEVSAGGIVTKPSAQGALIALVLDSYGAWTFPKGKLEVGETPEQAAVRELAEEVGLEELHLVATLGETRYRFLRENRPVRKRVVWFLFRAPAEAELHPRQEERIYDGGWFAPRTALRMLGYRNLRRVLRAAFPLLGLQ